MADWDCMAPICRWFQFHGKPSTSSKRRDNCLKVCLATVY